MNRGMNEEDVVYINSVTLFSTIRSKENLSFCKKMDKTCENLTQKIKPVSEIWVSYFSFSLI